ncbi:MAG: TldD/PmbA family protein [Gemmatimonadales bacterium]|nr:TldD/PmbA family protein [Gemmatimonadales bacterium]
MERRDFLMLTGAGAGLAAMPGVLPGSVVRGALTPIATADKKRLADTALEAARSAGATYADVRIGRYLNQFVVARDGKVQNVADTESMGAGVRVIAKGCWGFAATNDLTPDGIAAAAREAVAIAKANSIMGGEPVQLAPQKGFGEVSWKTPIEKSAFDVPIAEKVDLLKAASEAGLKAGANFMTAQIACVNEQKYFASTDGSYIDQDIHRLFPNFQVVVVDMMGGQFQQRAALSAPVGMGWEYVSGRPAGKVKLPTGLVYSKFYDMVEDARLAAEQAKEKVGAKSVVPGKYDLVLDPSHLWLTIHESVGHPTELDRILGYEANYAGTSFATLDKLQSRKFRYGSPIVNFVADKLQPGSLGAVGWDDEGVKTKQWDLVKDGTYVGVQAIRDQAHVIGLKESHGCCYAQSWQDVQFQRMPNVSLQAGKKPLSVEQMIAGVDKGIYIVGDGSFSIDQQRYNFQFGGKLFYEISKGKITGMLKDVAYQANTLEFWNACSAICDQRDYRLGGAFNDGKGQPGQSNAVSHGSATARFNGINVINTARKI